MISMVFAWVTKVLHHRDCMSVVDDAMLGRPDFTCVSRKLMHSSLKVLVANVANVAMKVLVGMTPGRRGLSKATLP